LGELEKTIEKQADAAIKSGLAGWWARADENQKAAVVGLAVAAAIGPLGQGIAGAFGVLFKEAALPSGKQVEAVFWLFLITLPVVAFILALMTLAGRMAGPAVLIAAGAASYFGGVWMASASIPDHLGDLYCYATLRSGGVHYEKACREFDTLGFLSHTQGSVGNPSKSADIFGWAAVYTADARGEVMLFAAIVGAIAGGYLLRRALESP
jgi:hypothetical protein